MDAEAAGALFEEMTPWLAESYWSWVTQRFTMRPGQGRYSPTAPKAFFNTPLLREFERTCRIRAEYTGTSLRDGMALLRARVTAAGAEFRLADFLVCRVDTVGVRDRLDLILREAGSAWAVGMRDGQPGLERRVPEGVQEAAEAAMRTPGRAGSRLAEAWRAAYSVSPNPAHSYALAVKAVEDAAIPAVVPRQTDATLGHVIGQLRRDGDWSLALAREEPTAPTTETVLRLCQALWKGHHDRHGGDASAPETVDQREAEAALQIAVFLVHGFASGTISRRPS